MRRYIALLAITFMAVVKIMAIGEVDLSAYSLEVKPLSLRDDSTSVLLRASSGPNALDKRVGEWTTKYGREVKPYRFKDDMTYVGVPLFVAGIIAKGEKASFRQDYNNNHSRARLLTNFHSEIDNYTQFVPAVLALGLNFSGVEGRSDHLRFLVNSAMAYGIMAAIVNPIKNSAKEMRPDGSTRNSWPSGHTATAFVSATILHKEYGLTRSPWYSVFGYGMATATGVMRVLNNRHWVSDVLSGAGVGILSTELAYGLGDIMFKGKHLKRNDLVTTDDVFEHPSFFDISMGVGLGTHDLTFSGKDLSAYSDDSAENVDLKFGTSTVVGAEGAYFFNKYVGIGGRLRVKSSPIKGWSDFAEKERASVENSMASLMEGSNLPEWYDTHDITIESDHLTEFSADFGAYFNFPLSRRWALGTKLLVGRSVMQDLEVSAHFAGKMVGLGDRGFDYVKDANGNDRTYDASYDYMTVSGNNTMKCGTGVSIKYAYKSNFSWKLFLDYDYSRKKYTMEYDPYQFFTVSSPEISSFLEDIMRSEYPDFTLAKRSSTVKKNMNSFVLGCAFTVSF